MNGCGVVGVNVEVWCDCLGGGGSIGRTVESPHTAYSNTHATHPHLQVIPSLLIFNTHSVSTTRIYIYIYIPVIRDRHVATLVSKVDGLAPRLAREIEAELFASTEGR